MNDHDHFHFLCDKCDKDLNFSQAVSGCTCGGTLFKVAWNVGVPRMENPIRDPYRRKKRPGTSDDGDLLTHPADTDPLGEPGTGFGTITRSKDDPRVKDQLSMYDQDYRDEVKKNIDDMEDTNLDHRPDEGPKPNTFTGSGDIIPESDLDTGPRGPHNMQKGVLKERTEFNRLTDNVIDFIRNKRRKKR